MANSGDIHEKGTLIREGGREKKWDLLGRMGQIMGVIKIKNRKKKSLKSVRYVSGVHLKAKQRFIWFEIGNQEAAEYCFESSVLGRSFWPAIFNG